MDRFSLPNRSRISEDDTPSGHPERRALEIRAAGRTEFPPGRGMTTNPPTRARAFASRHAVKGCHMIRTNEPVEGGPGPRLAASRGPCPPCNLHPAPANLPVIDLHAVSPARASRSIRVRTAAGAGV